jgi:hypothetical protein
MSAVSEQQWRVYELCHPDHRGLCIEEAAKVMGVDVYCVGLLLARLWVDHPDLFVDINNSQRGVLQHQDWMDGFTKKKF